MKISYSKPIILRLYMNSVETSVSKITAKHTPVICTGITNVVGLIKGRVMWGSRGACTLAQCMQLPWECEQMGDRGKGMGCPKPLGLPCSPTQVRTPFTKQN